MKEERMAVLNMLEKGSINVDEAERLLKLFQDEKPRRREREPRPERDAREKKDFDLGETADMVGKKISIFARKVGSKVEDVTAEMEPKIRKAAQTVADKTQEVAQDIKKTYDERKSAQEEAEYRHCDDPVCDDDFEDIVDGSIIELGQTPDAPAPEEEEKKDQDGTL